LLALCLAHRDQLEQATGAAERAVSLAPDLAFAHYALAHVLHDRKRFREALQRADEAVRLDPDDATYRGLRAAILFAQRDWQAALDAADEGLALDPEDVACNNLRALGLVELGRHAEAGQTIASTLARDPDNAFTHVSQGWALLHDGKVVPALEHFREALRLDPELEMARAGIVEAMKARNVVYRVLLRYFLWMNSLSHKAQWGILLGGYFGYQALRTVAEQNTTFAPWLTPLLAVYLVFAVMTWVAAPLFNLLLRLDRFGRHALAQEQITASNWFAGSIVLTLGLGLAWILTGAPDLKLYAMVSLFLMLPLAAAVSCPAGWPRWAMASYVLVLGAVGFSSVGLLSMIRWATTRAQMTQLSEYSLLGVQVFVWAALLSGFVANGLMMVQPRR
jgi:tetratricopeptide (TPR) repeat protein